MALPISRSFLEAQTVVHGGWGGAGRGRGKYIFKDNLKANIIFILIYPQSSLTRPQTCLMSKNCKMATNPTCLPLHSLWAVRGTQIFQQCDCCRQNGCKEHQGRQRVPNSQRHWATKLPIQENEVLPSTPCLSRTWSIHTSACELTWHTDSHVCMHMCTHTHTHATYTVRLAGSSSQACRPIPIQIFTPSPKKVHWDRVLPS